MRNLRIALCFILTTGGLIAYSQKHHVQFDHIGTNEGLSQSNVLCITSDSRGFMWFGTRDGLNKYDGYKFTLYKNNPADKTTLSDNYVRNVLESKDSNLWIATSGGGICKFDREKEIFERYRHDPKNANSISDDFVNNIIEDRYGMLWIATRNGLDMFDPHAKKFEHFVSDPGNKSNLSDSYIKFVFVDMDQDLWVCNRNGGINLFNRKSKTFTSFRHNENDARSIGSDNIYTMFQDSKHHIWIGTDGAGIDLLDKKAGTFSHFKNAEKNTNTLSGDVVYAINEDCDNNLWVGTENKGLSIFNYATGLFTTYKNDEVDKTSISNNSIFCIYRDLKNNMWLGSFSGGVNLVNRDKIQFTHYRHMMLHNSLSDDHVLTILEDSKKNIWIGTDGGGLNLFDPLHSNFAHYRYEKNNRKSVCGDYILTLCEDSKGNIWIGTWANGVSVFNPSNNSFRHYKNDPANPSSLSNNNAWKIFEDKEKNIWIGTLGGGLNLLNPEHNSFTHYQYDKKKDDGISSNNVVALFEDSDQQLWIGTSDGGLNVFNRKLKTFSRFQYDDTKNSISNNSISSIMQGSDKNLWIGTRTGLNKFNAGTKKFTAYTTADGLPDNVIAGVLEDGKKNLWISTNKGISHFTPSTKLFENFGVSDGLQANEFKEQAFCKTKSGIMYFGGNNGFNQFNPDSINTDAFDPPLVITSFQIFNKEVPVAVDKDDPSPLLKNISETKTITIPWSKAVFSFEFATLNYTSSEKKKYAYKLKGFDKTWNETGTSRIATYTNIDPGKYIFMVRGLNNKGGWSSKITSIQLTIKPPFWLTWWFKLAFFLVIAGSATAFYRFRINVVKAQKAKLQQLVKEQTQQLLLSTEEEQKARKEADISRSETEIANTALQKKNKELEQFAYVASHDLQEPLRTVSGFIELIQQQYRGKFDEKADKYLNYISDASDRMKVLIMDLLDFSRIGINVDLKSIDCNILMKNILKDLFVAINESGADIRYFELPVIFGYATEVHLLFQNLVVNAIKFRKKDLPPKINISARRNEYYWEFAISDNGIGIDSKFKDKIFDIFQRLHTRKDYAGSGIGLSHCKKVVELHNGKIWVQSVPGEGSTFYFLLPALQAGSELQALDNSEALHPAGMQ